VMAVAVARCTGTRKSSAHAPLACWRRRKIRLAAKGQQQGRARVLPSGGLIGSRDLKLMGSFEELRAELCACAATMLRIQVRFGAILSFVLGASSCRALCRVLPSSPSIMRGAAAASLVCCMAAL
jgi:hypothetical protein